MNLHRFLSRSWPTPFRHLLYRRGDEVFLVLLDAFWAHRTISIGSRVSISTTRTSHFRCRLSSGNWALATSLVWVPHSRAVRYRSWALFDWSWLAVLSTPSLLCDAFLFPSWTSIPHNWLDGQTSGLGNFLKDKILGTSISQDFTIVLDIDY